MSDNTNSIMTNLGYFMRDYPNAARATAPFLLVGTFVTLEISGAAKGIAHFALTIFSGIAVIATLGLYDKAKENFANSFKSFLYFTSVTFILPLGCTLVGIPILIGLFICPKEIGEKLVK